MVGNLMALQADLQRLSDPQLMQEMQNPTGSVPQYLTLSELKRRQELRKGQAPTGQQLTTVTQDVLRNEQQPLQRANFPMMAGNPSNMGQPGMLPATTMRGSFDPRQPAPAYAGGGMIQHFDQGGNPQSDFRFPNIGGQMPHPMMMPPQMQHPMMQHPMAPHVMPHMMPPQMAPGVMPMGQGGGGQNGIGAAGDAGGQPGSAGRGPGKDAADFATGLALGGVGLMGAGTVGGMASRGMLGSAFGPASQRNMDINPATYGFNRDPGSGVASNFGPEGGFAQGDPSQGGGFTGPDAHAHEVSVGDTSVGGGSAGGNGLGAGPGSGPDSGGPGPGTGGLYARGGIMKLAGGGYPDSGSAEVGAHEQWEGDHPDAGDWWRRFGQNFADKEGWSMPGFIQKFGEKEWGWPSAAAPPVETAPSSPSYSSVGPGGSQNKGAEDVHPPRSLQTPNAPPVPPPPPRSGVTALRPESAAVPQSRSYEDILGQVQAERRGQNDVMDRLEEARADASKTKNYNKWMALAELGFGMASSKSPYLAQQVGEGGIRALGSYGKAEQERRADELKSLGYEATVADNQAAREVAERQMARTSYEHEQDRTQAAQLANQHLKLGYAQLNKSPEANFMGWYLGLPEDQQDRVKGLYTRGLGDYRQGRQETQRLDELRRLEDDWNKNHPMAQFDKTQVNPYSAHVQSEVGRLYGIPGQPQGGQTLDWQTGKPLQ